jgi:hypothetical protein
MGNMMFSPSPLMRAAESSLSSLPKEMSLDDQMGKSFNAQSK